MEKQTGINRAFELWPFDHTRPLTVCVCVWEGGARQEMLPCGRGLSGGAAGAQEVNLLRVCDACQSRWSLLINEADLLSWRQNWQPLNSVRSQLADDSEEITAGNVSQHHT